MGSSFRRLLITVSDADSSIVYHCGTSGEYRTEDQGGKKCNPNISVFLCILCMHLESF